MIWLTAQALFCTMASAMQILQTRVLPGENTSDIARSFGLSNEALCASNPGRAVERTPWGHVYFMDLQEGDLLSLPADRAAYPVEVYDIISDLADQGAHLMVDAAVPLIIARLPEISQAMVDQAMPLITARVPELSQQFVDSAMPMVQAKLTDLAPQLTELAQQSAQTILADDQMKATIQGLVGESIQSTQRKMAIGFFLSTVGTAVLVLGGMKYFGKL